GAGNVTALVGANGDLLARYLYNPFGKLVGQWGPLANANMMQFSSMPRHVNSGLSLYALRGYDPNLQRWLTMDPVGEVGGINLYRLVGNSPPNSVDPFGESDFNRPPVLLSIGIPGAATTVLYGPPALDPERGPGARNPLKTAPVQAVLNLLG